MSSLSDRLFKKDSLSAQLLKRLPLIVILGIGVYFVAFKWIPQDVRIRYRFSSMATLQRISTLQIFLQSKEIGRIKTVKINMAELAKGLRFPEIEDQVRLPKGNYEVVFDIGYFDQTRNRFSKEIEISRDDEMVVFVE